MIKKNILSLLFVILYITSFAQIVNVEKKRKDTKGFQATLSLDFNLKDNGKRFTELKNNIDLQYSHKAHTFIFLNNIKLLNIDKGSFINNGFQHLRYNYTLKDTGSVTLEAFVQHQYNEQKLLKKRFITGGGPRIRLVKTERITWYVAPLAMYEYELLSDSLSSVTKLFRLDSYTNFRFSFNDLVSFNHITYYQPDFGNFEDFRISSETGFRFNIGKHLSYGVNYSFDYDNQPPENVQNTFWYLNNKLILKL